MIYHDFQELKLSALGLGCMRFPVLGGDAAQIDEGATAAMVARAMERGINYYDTAWGYHSGNSEPVMGKILAEYPRESFYLASKFPGYDLNHISKVEEIFEQQLERCRVDYFDFYLFHNVCETNIDAYLDPQYGIFDYLMKQKANGRIRHLGFSAHGNMDTMKRFLDACGAHMEFCQIQLNWLDWTLQRAKEKVELLRRHSIPIWVMEPVRGGKLAKLPEEWETKLKAVRPDWSVPEWAFRFVQGIEGVTVTLSGMSSLQQLEENLRTYETKASLTDAELEVLMGVAKEMTAAKTLPCTACRYCTDHCPQELNIPWLLELYNEFAYTGDSAVVPNMALAAVPEGRKPSVCVGCRSCETVCPQQIEISEAMRVLAEKQK